MPRLLTAQEVSEKIRGGDLVRLYDLAPYIRLPLSQWKLGGVARRLKKLLGIRKAVRIVFIREDGQEAKPTDTIGSLRDTP